MGAIVCSIIAGAIFAPIFVFGRIRRVWWKWLTLARFAETGWTEEELRRVSNDAGIVNDHFLGEARRVLDAAEKVKGGRPTFPGDTGLTSEGR